MTRMRRRAPATASLAIEARVYPRPWSTSLFLSEIAQRTTRTYLVATSRGRRRRLRRDDVHGPQEAHVTNIAVDPEFHGHRVGIAPAADASSPRRWHGGPSGSRSRCACPTRGARTCTRSSASRSSGSQGLLHRDQRGRLRDGRRRRSVRPNTGCGCESIRDELGDRDGCRR